MKTRISVISVILFVLTSCNSKPKISFDGEFADSKPINSVSLDLQPCQLEEAPLAPWSCCFLDSLFIIEENPAKMDKNFFKVYNNGKLVYQFGESGNGPEDFDFPNLISAGKSEHGHFYTTDGARTFEISIAPNGLGHKIQNMPMPEDFVLVNNVLLYNDSAIVVTQTGEFQLQRFDKKTKQVVGYNYFDNAGGFSNYDNFSLAGQLYQSVCSSNGEYAILGYHKLNMIDIISLSDMSLHKRVCFSNYDCNDYVIDNDGNIIFDRDKIKYFFSFVTASEDKFYALCWNCTSEEAASGKKMCSIYEFDYDGNIIKQYTPNVSITTFAVKDDTIYANGYDQNIEEFVIWKGALE